jgi:hypothetical protein
VLGAGASAPYGFPLGWQLTEQIIALLEDDEAPDLLSDSKSTIRKFVQAFEGSGQQSIDAFLAVRQEFSGIGKRAIALCILRAEKQCREKGLLYGDWYQFFLNEIARAPTWQELQLGDIAIVTFNYDRSLEVFLHHALMHRYGREIEEVRAKVFQELKIVHVYGSISPKIPFGAENSVESFAVEKAAESIQVIPQSRGDTDEIRQCQRLLSEANVVAVLGFGFDPVNLERLGAGRTLFNITKGSNSGVNTVDRPVFATCQGIPALRVRQAAIAMGLAHPSGYNQRMDGLPHNFFRADCRQLLSETGVLGNFENIVDAAHFLPPVR